MPGLLRLSRRTCATSSGEISRTSELASLLIVHRLAHQLSFQIRWCHPVRMPPSSASPCSRPPGVAGRLAAAAAAVCFLRRHPGRLTTARTSSRPNHGNCMNISTVSKSATYQQRLPSADQSAVRPRLLHRQVVRWQQHHLQPTTPGRPAHPSPAETRSLLAGHPLWTRRCEAPKQDGCRCAHPEAGRAVAGIIGAQGPADRRRCLVAQPGPLVRLQSF